MCTPKDIEVLIFKDYIIPTDNSKYNIECILDKQKRGFVPPFKTAMIS